jgi:hypothetical protein
MGWLGWAGWLGWLAAQTCAFYAAFDGLQLILQWKCAFYALSVHYG